MAIELKHHNPRWIVATVNRPLLWPRCDNETWSLTPPNRYVINAEHLTKFGDLATQVSAVSDLVGSSLYRPFVSTLNLFDAKILVERHRSRGIGDLLFMTGPLSYLHHMSGGTVDLYVKSLVDRGTILTHHPAIKQRSTIFGPTFYDTLPLYRYHWFIESATEFDEEPDQANVYDVLFRQLGFDPSTIDPKFKRPSVGFDESDTKGLHIFYQIVYQERQIDLRSTPYYVVAPFSFGKLRTKSYSFWLNLIKELSAQAPVIVVGSIRESIPTADDMSAGEFYHTIEQDSVKGGNVISILGNTPLRIVLTIISKSKCVFGLDSAPLYMAQACRVPAISIWGTHSPAVRIGYDPDYMELAVWKNGTCPSSPCFAYSGLPTHKCPRREDQISCEVLSSATVEDVMEKLEKVQ